MNSSIKFQIADLKVDEALTKVLSKYIDFADVFSSKLAVELLKYIRINNHTIELVDDWQLPFDPIYSLGLVELEILKAYIKNNLVNSFIRSSKSLARVLIFFNKKPDRSLRLYMDYRDLNKLIIRNWYPLSLVGEL